MMRSYTLPELEKLWDEYVAAFVSRWLVAGKWEHERPAEKVVATRAERVKFMDHKTFIEFLKEKANG